MKALITGASSGIGLEIARELSMRGYDLIVVARSKDKLLKLKEELKTSVLVYEYDLSVMENCYSLYDNVKDMEVDIVVNYAGFGDFGDYRADNLDKEMNMIALNVKCLHILTKLFVNNCNTKYIMNVASSAGLMKG